MRNDFEHERRVWNDEVDAEAARLIRNGTPPLQAIEMARDAVSRRRQGAAGIWPYSQCKTQ
jgi:hypothetical protein